MFDKEQNDKLAAPLSPSRVKQRTGAGNKSFDHIEGWDAIRHANEVFGFDGWSRETVELREVWSGEKKNDRGTKHGVAYVARVRVTVYAGVDRIVVRDGTGFGNGDGWNPGEAHELAVKEAETDAMKRALASFGYGFGLALYDKSKEHVYDEDKSDGGEAPKQSHSGKKDQSSAGGAGSASSTRPAQTKASAKKSDETPVEKPASGNVQTLPPGKKPPKHFEAPEIPSGATAQAKLDAWRAWSRGPIAAIKACSNADDADAVLCANKAEFDRGQSECETNIRAHMIDLIKKRWPEYEPTEENISAVAPPQTHTRSAWNGWASDVCRVIERMVETMEELEYVLRLNAEHFASASAALETDVGEQIRAYGEKRIAKLSKQSKGPAR